MNKIAGLRLFSTVLSIVFLSIITNKSIGYEIDEYAIKHIESATKAADLKYDIEQTMDPPVPRDNI